MAWNNHEDDPMEQMRRAFLAEIKDWSHKNDLLKKQQTMKDKSREFYCSKVKDKEKCND